MWFVELKDGGRVVWVFGSLCVSALRLFRPRSIYDPNMKLYIV
jgi:hypothetical protein